VANFFQAPTDHICPAERQHTVEPYSRAGRRGRYPRWTIGGGSEDGVDKCMMLTRRATGGLYGVDNSAALDASRRSVATL
jgi:hypothetical protein